MLLTRASEYALLALNEIKNSSEPLGANKLIQWITSNKGQHLIGKFKIAGKVLFTPNATSMANIEKKLPIDR